MLCRLFLLLIMIATINVATMNNGKTMKDGNSGIVPAGESGVVLEGAPVDTLNAKMRVRSKTVKLTS